MKDIHVLYFAHGSNMKKSRMRKRIPEAEVIGPAWIDNKRLVCNKISKDGSGKANLANSPGHRVWGVLYKIPQNALQKLDQIEGGYDRRKLEVTRAPGEKVEAPGEKVEAFVYVSTKTDDSLKPFDWYKSFIVEGAREHKLPDEYIQELEALPSMPRCESNRE